MKTAEEGGLVTRSSAPRGFALVTTLGLLAMLVLAVFALTSLVKVNSRIGSVTLYRAQARQNALLALNVAVGELQRQAGSDNCVTGMAGVSGVATGSSFRQWMGVWKGSDSPVWLVSGSDSSISPSLTGDRITIVGVNSVGVPSDPTDQEFVEVGLVGLSGTTVGGLSSATGRIGYWVGDEGVKVSAVIAAAEMQSNGAGRELRPNLRGLVGATFNSTDANNARLISLEQLKEAAAGFSLLKSFHSLTRSHRALESTAAGISPRPDSYVVGAFNINTTSEAAWRALLEFPDSSDSAFVLDATRTLSAARQIRDRIAARKTPFSSVAALRNSNIIQQAFDASTPKVTTITQDVFFEALGSIFTTRSDTFRIRAYGDTLNPANPAMVAASAYCEAIVQRTPEVAPSGLGHRFIVTYFRWLGRDDI